MGRIKRGGYLFECWIGDHPPQHVHIIKDGRLIARVELDAEFTLIEGRIDRRIKGILKSLLKEGLLK